MPIDLCIALTHSTTINEDCLSVTAAKLQAHSPLAKNNTELMHCIVAPQGYTQKDTSLKH